MESEGCAIWSNDSEDAPLFAIRRLLLVDHIKVFSGGFVKEKSQHSVSLFQRCGLGQTLHLLIRLFQFAFQPKQINYLLCPRCRNRKNYEKLMPLFKLCCLCGHFQFDSPNRDFILTSCREGITFTYSWGQGCTTGNKSSKGQIGKCGISAPQHITGCGLWVTEEISQVCCRQQGLRACIAKHDLLIHTCGYTRIRCVEKGSDMCSYR